MTLEITQFDPTVKELNELVESTRYLSLADLRDKEQLKVVKEARIKLRDARVKIEKKGKELRAEATAFGKAVIAKEKELIGIVEPEEDRLKAFEEKAAEIAEMDKREELLPERREKLLAIGDGIEVADDVLLKMDDTDFEAYYNKRVFDKNEKARLDLERREREVKETEEKQQREKDRIAAEERGRVAERERIEKEQKEERERIDREKKAEEERIERERVARERKMQEEKERLERDQKYQMFLSVHGYSEETKDKFHIIKEGNVVRIYMLTGTIEL